MIGVVTFGLTRSSAERKTAIWFLFFLMVLGLFLHTGLWFGGAWNDWRMLLGWLPATRAINTILLVVPVLLLVPVFFWPLGAMVRRIFLDRLLKPRAFHFDNESRRVLIDESSAAPVADRRRLDGLSGYGYHELSGFEITSYVTQSLRSSSGRARETTHYVVGFRKADGQFWSLEEFLSRADAVKLVSGLEQDIALAGSDGEEPGGDEPKVPSGVLKMASDSTVLFAWSGRAGFVGPFVGVAGASALVWFGILLNQAGFVPGFVFCVGFAVLMAALCLVGFVRGIKRLLLAHAIQVGAGIFETGTIPRALLKAGQAHRAFSQFKVKDRWPLDEVKSVSTVFDRDSRGSPVQRIMLRGRSESGAKVTTRTLDVAGLSLSQTVDLEHVIEGEIAKGGGHAR